MESADRVDATASAESRPEPLRVCYVSRSQFGHMVPTYYNCVYLAPLCTLSVVTLDKNLPRFDLPNATLLYAPHRSTAAARWRSLISTTIRACRNQSDVVFVEHFIGCGVIPALCGRTPAIVDIRTGSIATRGVHRAIADFVLRLDSRAYPHVSVISEGLRDRFHLPKSTTHVVPLGAVERTFPDRSYASGLRLLYVGTLSGRRLEDTLRGLALSATRHPNVPISSFDIVGTGLEGDSTDLPALARSLGLDSVVKFHGFIHQIELDSFYESANAGVAYIPHTPYYDVQPPTKTFEYLLAGLPVIGTAIDEHKKILGETNGVVVNDTPEDFSDGLALLWRNRQIWRADEIRASVRAYSWQRIITDILWPLIEGVATVPRPRSRHSSHAR